MKKVLFLSTLLLLFVSCAQQDNKEKTNESNINTVKQYLEALRDKRIAAVDSLLADNFVLYGPSYADSLDKQSAMKNLSIISETYYDSLQMANPMMIAAEVTGGAHPGDFVSAWTTVRLTYMDTARSPVNIFVNVLFRVENGKITLIRRFYNEADIMRQSGFNPLQSE